MAKLHGDHILLDVQEGVQLRLTVNEALMISQSAKAAACEALDVVQPVPACAQIIAFHRPTKAA